MPLSFIVAIILVFNGTPMTFDGKVTITAIKGKTQNESRDPVAVFFAIKQLGTNGGGFYGANSANPM